MRIPKSRIILEHSVLDDPLASVARSPGPPASLAFVCAAVVTFIPSFAASEESFRSTNFAPRLQGAATRPPANTTSIRIVMA
jgi:hypothetical protein